VDGRERSNANAFLLVATEEPTVEREIEKNSYLSFNS